MGAGVSPAMGEHQPWRATGCSNLAGEAKGLLEPPSLASAGRAGLLISPQEPGKGHRSSRDSVFPSAQGGAVGTGL